MTPITCNLDRRCQALCCGETPQVKCCPVIQRSVALRNPYVDPLNYVQLETLRCLRALPDAEGPAAEDLWQVMVVTVNGIAVGLRNTG